MSTAGGSTPAWFLDNSFASSGSQHLYGPNLSTTNDSRVYIGSTASLPSQAYLYFKHSFGFENFSTTYYDGGVVEYSTNGGVTWIDAGFLIDAGASYGGAINNLYGNPLSGRSGFVADSFGYTTSRLNLSSLAGMNVQFRWRVGSDISLGDYGWYVDDVSIYTCVTTIFADGFESGNTSNW